ncbi:MAG: type II CRISPR RNA-guided endonuclease Cas9, partial [Clostridiales bacterium]|nr:type II CRISPR RNA-guided endonuclease Cas9 [Clostridiales bacterium]
AKTDASENVKTAFCRYDRGAFLPKQITSDNGVIPYQLHLKELELILKNASEKFAFLSTRDGGTTVAEKIVSLLTFKIPYYVGPLGGGKFAWAVRKGGNDRVKVTPWNFDDVIDRDASEDKFIERMTAKCSYIPTEDVLPKNSLLYSEATLLNELNNLRTNGVKDDRAIELVFEYAHAHKKITQKAIRDILKRNGYAVDDMSLSGIDGDMKSSLSSYIDFKKIMGDLVETDRDMCENIVKAITLTSDKSRLRQRIRRSYGDKLSDIQIKAICGLGYSGWGRLSKKLLCEIISQKSIGSGGAPRDVISTMREEKINLSEALTAERWGFGVAIDEYNASFDDKTNIDGLYCSPSVKRAIRRTLAIVSEIVKTRGSAPKKIMVEMARGGDESETGDRKSSRKQQLLSLYKSVKSDARDFSKEIEAVGEDRKFSSKRLYLYYLQNGKCMYTGEPIDLASLNDKNTYDIDHIYPRSKINDSSFDNLVLVKREANARKRDVYPLSADIRNKMSGFWRCLRENKLLTQRKYDRLVRNTPLSAQELADFENRQLVMMRQSTKEVASVLRRMFPDSEIVYSKAQKAAEFKDRFGEYAEKSGVEEFSNSKLVKVRELNDLHHAKDAYINVVVGNVLNTEYGHDASVFYRNKSAEEMRSDYSLFINGVDGAWQPDRHLGTVYNTYYNDNVRVVRFVGEGSGAMFNATIKTAGANDKLIPLKANGKISDTSKYGGYDSASTAYFSLVKSKDGKGNARLSLEAIPIIVEKNIAAGKDRVSDYLRNMCGLVEPQIVIEKIRLNTLFSIDGSLAYIRGRQGNDVLWCNAVEPYVATDALIYIKKVSAFVKKYAEAKRFKREMYVDEEYDGITRDGNLRLYELFIEKLDSKLYKGFPIISKQAAALRELSDKFREVDCEMQCVVLMKILAFLNCNSVNLDLSDFVDESGKPLGKECGKLRANKFIENKNVKMISQSPTGHYRTVVDFDKFK